MAETLYSVEKIEIDTGMTVDRYITNREDGFKQYLGDVNLEIGADGKSGILSSSKTGLRIYQDSIQKYAYICKVKEITPELLLSL